MFWGRKEPASATMILTMLRINLVPARQGLSCYFAIHPSTIWHLPFHADHQNATLTIWPWWRHYTFKRFLHYWPFVRRRTGNWSIPLTKGRPVTRSLDVLFDISMNKLLNKLSNCQWFETPRHPYDVIVVLHRCTCTPGPVVCSWPALSPRR